MKQTIIYAAAGFLVLLLMIFFYLRWSATSEDPENDFEKTDSTEEYLDEFPDDDDAPIEDDEYMIIDN